MDGLSNGAKIYVRITALVDKLGGVLGNLVTQTTVSLFVTTLVIMIIAYIASRKIEKRPGKLQVVSEKLVTMLYNLVEETMGKHNLCFAPYIGTLFLSSVMGTLLGMTQLFRSSTADLSVPLAWALVTTALVWYNTIKRNGLKGWLKGFTEPIWVMTPMNIVSEIAQPLSMAFRHFGNVAGGGILTALIYTALGGISHFLIGRIPNVIVANIPFLQVGVPAFLSIYFDLFSGFVQAFVFSLLTMVYVGGACPPPEEA